MKKVLAFLILLVYFTVSTGFVVSLHYCMDRFHSAQLGHSDSRKCSRCGMHKSDGCCHDDVKVVKLSLSHTAGGALAFLPEVPSAIVEHSFPLPYSTDLSTTAVAEPRQGAPPGQPPAYLRYCVFRL